MEGVDEEIIESSGNDDSSQGADYGAIFYDVFVRDNGGIVLANWSLRATRGY